MIAEIIAVGTELLMGQIANTNAQFIAQHLTELGIDHYVQTVIGDNPHRLAKVTEQAEQRADVIIYSGGLGPTQDDLTKVTIANHLNEELIYDEVGLAKIKQNFVVQKREMVESNLKMGLVFENGQVFENTTGQALGTAITKDKKTYILLPGPPHEMKPMFTNSVRPFLRASLQENIHLKSAYVQTFGIGESDLTTRLDDIITKQNNPTIASYFSGAGVTLRVTARSNDRDEVDSLITNMISEIKSRVGTYIYGIGDNYTLSHAVVDYLKKTKQTISFAESLTGGMAGSEIVSIEGSSEVFHGSIVAYDAVAKSTLLNVSQDILESKGMVSQACAKEMAEGARQQFNSDIAISFTGVAGPDKMENKEVGTVFVAIARKGREVEVLPLNLSGSREKIRRYSINSAFQALIV